MKRNPKDIQKILLVTLSNLGDVMLTLPALQSLYENFPTGTFHVLVGVSGQEVFRADSRVKRVTVYDKKAPWAEKFKLLSEIRRERYSLIIDLRHSFFGLLGGAKYRNPYLDFSAGTIHQSEKHLSALKKIVRDKLEEDDFLWAGPRTAPIPDENRFGHGKRIVVAAVGSKSDIKKWPVEYFAGLLDRLALNDDCQIVLAGDKHDAVDADRVCGLMQSGAINLCGRTNFDELCSLLKAAELVITNDSAPLHIADALKTRVLAIFGPTDPRRYGPRHSGSLAVQKTLFCSPCRLAQCRYRHECMTELAVEALYQKALQLLNDECQPKNLKILISRLDRIGDVVMSLPAVGAIRERFPNAMITMMVRPYVRGLVEGHPAIDEVITYDYEKNGRHRFILGNFRCWREIVKRHFDIAFILHPSNRSFNIPFLAGIPYRVGFRSKYPFHLTHSVPDRRHEGLKHESEYTMDIVRAFGIHETGRSGFTLPVYAYDKLQISKLLANEACAPDEKIIALHPGASCLSKKWPVERFAALGKLILKEMPYRVALIGGPEEKASGEFIKKELGDRLVNLTGRLELKNLAAFLKRCELLISNDSGPIHIAAAVGTRTFGIFGRNRAGLSAVRWRALGEGHTLVQKDVGCVVCLAHRCTIDFECLKAVEVKDVYDRVKAMLSINNNQIPNSK